MSRTRTTTPFLSKDHIPTGTDVIIGRGKKCYNHEGNKKLRSIVASKLDDYAMSKTKSEKSTVLATIVTQIRTSNPAGKFIRMDADTKLWFDVGNDLAKEKISQTFRDALADLYSSSNDVRKKKRRRETSKDKNDPSLKQARIQSGAENSRNPAFSERLNKVTDPFNTDLDPHDSLEPNMYLYANPFEPTPIEEMVHTPIEKMLFQNTQKNASFRKYAIGNNGLTQKRIEESDELEEIDTSWLFPSAA